MDRKEFVKMEKELLEEQKVLQKDLAYLTQLGKLQDIREVNEKLRGNISFMRKRLKIDGEYLGDFMNKI